MVKLGEQVTPQIIVLQTIFVTFDFKLNSTLILLYTFLIFNKYVSVNNFVSTYKVRAVKPEPGVENRERGKFSVFHGLMAFKHIVSVGGEWAYGSSWDISMDKVSSWKTVLKLFKNRWVDGGGGKK